MALLQPRQSAVSTGLPGADGISPVISIGVVTVVDDPQDAAVTLGGTPSSPVMNMDLPRGLPGTAGSEGLPAEPGGGIDPGVDDNGLLYAMTRAVGDPFTSYTPLTPLTVPAAVDRFSVDLRPSATAMTGYRWTQLPTAAGAPADTYILEASGGGNPGLTSFATTGVMLAGKRTILGETASTVAALQAGRFAWKGSLIQRATLNTALPIAAKVGDTITSAAGAGTIVAIDDTAITIWRTAAFSNGDTITGPSSAYSGTINSLSSYTALFVRLNTARGETPYGDPNHAAYGDGYFAVLPNSSIPLFERPVPFGTLRAVNNRQFIPQTPSASGMGWDPTGNYSGIPITITSAQSAITGECWADILMPLDLDPDSNPAIFVRARRSAVPDGAATSTILAELWAQPNPGGSALGTSLISTAAQAITAAANTFQAFTFGLTLGNVLVPGQQYLLHLVAAYSNAGAGTGANNGFIGIGAAGLSYYRRS